MDPRNPLVGAWGNGMTLRDWFAGLALAGLLADTRSAENIRDESTLTETFARWSYEYADQMLKARGET